MNINKQVYILKALADVTRLTIVKRLSQYKSLTCSEISKMFNLMQPTLSHHFKRLIKEDVVIAQKKHTHMVYSLNKKLLKSVGILF